MMPCSWSIQKGFSYLFTLLMVAMLGLGLVAATDVYTTSVRRDKEKELLSIGRQFRNAVSQYYESNLNGNGAESKNVYPKGLEDLLLDSRSLSVRRYLRKIFVDPMTGKAEWGEVRVGGRLVGIYSLSNQMPIKQAFSEADELNFNGKTKYSDWVFTYPIDLMNIPPSATSKVTFSDTNPEESKQEAPKVQNEK